MKFTGKYKQLADQFRADGCDEAMVERFVREEMERDEFKKNKGTTDIDAYLNRVIDDYEYPWMIQYP